MEKIILYTASIIIYTISTCPYCIKAKVLLNKKMVKYKEINIENDNSLREAIVKKSNGSTSVPQIFINDVHIGGCDDLYILENQGKLDELLK